jgi:hypothetical protein
LLLLFAALDGACTLAGWPLTTLSWSPALFLVLGFVLITLESLERDSRPGRDIQTPPGTRPRTIP